jgi:DNA-binding protein HU-beta
MVAMAPGRFQLALAGLCRYPLRPYMATLTKSQIVAALAERVVITKKQAVQLLDLVAELAYKQAKNSFTLPGIGKLVLVDRAARTMTMQFGPKKGQTVTVPARRVVRFRVAKAAKVAILGAK